MRVNDQKLRELVAASRVHLVFVAHFQGADAWLLLETPKPRDGYANEGHGSLLTLEGEHSYWRNIVVPLGILDTLGITTEPGSTRLALRGAAGCKP